MKKEEGLATASLVIGIISLVLSFIIGIFVVPLAVVGIVLGIVNLCTNGKKYAGVILNSIAFVFSIFWSIVLTFILSMLGIFMIDYSVDDFNHYEEEIEEWFDDDKDHDIEKEDIEDTIKFYLGKWNCYEDDATEYIVHAEFREDGTFTWAKYEDIDNNHVYGNYLFQGGKKKKMELKGTEFVLDGQIQDEGYSASYDVSYDEDLIIMSLSNSWTNKEYSCKLVTE